MTEADTGVRQLRAKECQGSIATIRRRQEKTFQKGETDGSEERAREKQGSWVTLAARVWGNKRVGLGGDRGGGSHWQKAGKGRGESGGPPQIPLPSPMPGFPIWAGAACQERPHVCASSGWKVTGAWRGGCKNRKGPRAWPRSAGRFTRGLRGRRPSGPACDAAAERPRPGGAMWGKESARQPGRRARLPLPVSGPHCRG